MNNEKETVELIASGYEWVCPECEELNREIEITEKVVCEACGREYETGETYQAYG